MSYCNYKKCGYKKKYGYKKKQYYKKKKEYKYNRNNVNLNRNRAKAKAEANPVVNVNVGTSLINTNVNLDLVFTDNGLFEGIGSEPILMGQVTVPPTPLTNANIQFSVNWVPIAEPGDDPSAAPRATFYMMHQKGDGQTELMRITDTSPEYDAPVVTVYNFTAPNVGEGIYMLFGILDECVMAGRYDLEVGIY